MQSGSIEGCKSFCKNITNNVEGIDKVDFWKLACQFWIAASKCHKYNRTL